MKTEPFDLVGLFYVTFPLGNLTSSCCSAIRAMNNQLISRINLKIAGSSTLDHYLLIRVPEI